MKIPRSVRELYDRLSSRYIPLKQEVDQLLSGRRNTSWHYESRLKSLDSFALKLESGRWKDEGEVDDLLAAVLVVDNLSSLHEAECLVDREFDVIKRRPTSRHCTTTKAESFPFDDTRLYVRWRADSEVPKPQYEGLLFEVQLRTYLQHAWNVATHDVVYKTERLEWPRERLAAQVRASLEQAEVALHEIDTLSKSDVLRRTDRDTEQISAVADLLEGSWERERLPSDIKRLSINVFALIMQMEISVSRLQVILSDEELVGRGARIQNLSPFGVIVQSLMHREPDATRRLFCSKDRGFSIWIPAEIDLPKGMEEGGFHDVVVLGQCSR